MLSLNHLKDWAGSGGTRILIPSPGRWRQVNLWVFEDSQDYIENPCFKKKEKRTSKKNLIWASSLGLFLWSFGCVLESCYQAEHYGLRKCSRGAFRVRLLGSRWKNRKDMVQSSNTQLSKLLPPTSSHLSEFLQPSKIVLLAGDPSI